MDLVKEADKFSVEITQNMLKKFEIYEKMMLEYNSVMNLTAITESDAIKEKHFLDSVSIISCGKLTEGCKLIDIGAGAGFPSIPVKIVREDIKLTMIDSLNKRVEFLRDVIDKTNLENACAVHMRAEEAGRCADMRETFDVATARAVADLAVLAEYALPLVKVGGYFVAMKGNNPSEEVDNAKKAIEKTGGKTEDIKEIILPSGIRHSLITIKKVISTPSTYPRKSGKPSKEPIA